MRWTALLLGAAALVAAGGASSAGSAKYQASAIVAGGSHTCAIVVRGKVKCWGDDSGGQLGDGGGGERKTPVSVVGLSGVRAVTAGDGHTCALTKSHGVKCWGYDDSGQIGNGKRGEYLAYGKPVQVIGLTSGVEDLSSGDGFTCALMSSGTVKCWGEFPVGSIHKKPSLVKGLSGVRAIAAGSAHICALLATGGVMCLGSNFNGELGNGTTDDSDAPVAVSGLTGQVQAIEAGGYSTAGNSCALLAGGRLLCWGFNEDGEVGDGTTSDRHAPTQVSGLDAGVAAVSFGHRRACVIVTGGAVKCWGKGPLGDGTEEDSGVPVDVSGLAGAQAIASGGQQSCAIIAKGAVECWGENLEGAIGDGTTRDRLVPVKVKGF